MKTLRFTTLQLLVTFLLVATLSAQDLFIDPERFEEEISADENLELILRLFNEGDSPIEWRLARQVRLVAGQEVEDAIRFVNNENYEVDDLIRQYDDRIGGNPFYYDGELVWFYDSGWRGYSGFNPFTGEITNWFHKEEGMWITGIIDGNFWFHQINTPLDIEYVYNRNGELIDQFDFPFDGVHKLRYIAERNCLMGVKNRQLWVFDPEELNLIRIIDLEQELGIQNQQLIRFDVGGFTWVPQHEDGELWVAIYRRMLVYQIDVDENWNLTLSQSFLTFQNDESSIIHNGENLWRGWFVYEDGISEFPWFDIDKDSGVIEAGGDEELLITFNGNFCEEGEYEIILQVLENNSIEPLYEVRVNVIVSGEPHIELSWEHDDNENLINWGDYFEDLYTFSTRTVPVAILNSGTSVLTVENISIEGGTFSINQDEMTIECNEQNELLIEFNPQEAGFYESRLFLTTNDPESEQIIISLRALAVQPPRIEVDLDNLVDEITVGEENSHELCIDNTGNSELRWEALVELTDHQFSLLFPTYQLGYDPPDVNPGEVVRSLQVPSIGMSCITFFEDVIVCFCSENLILHLNPDNGELLSCISVGCGFNGATFDGENFWTRFVNRQFNFLILDREGIIQDTVDHYKYRPSTLGSDYQDYIFTQRDRDGGIFVLSIETHEEIAYLENIEGLINDDIRRIIYVPTHLEGPLWIVGERSLYQFSIDFDNDWEVELVNEIDWELDRRRFRDLNIKGHDGRYFYSMDENNNLYFIEDGIEEYCWVQVEPNSGELESNQTAEIEIFIDPSGLFEGEYNANLQINSNDPVNPNIVIPVSLDVEGIPQLDLDWEFRRGQNQMVWNRSYRDVFPFTEFPLTMHFRNAGTGPLEIESISCNNEHFTIQEQQFIIPCRRDRSVEISFACEEPGEYEGELRIECNDPDNNEILVELEVTVEPGPVITVNPEQFVEEATQGENVSLQITIDNEGESRLVYEITREAIEPDEELRNVRSTRRSPNLQIPDDPNRDEEGDILGEIRIPVHSCSDLAYDGELIWGVDPTLERLISFNPRTREITHNIDLDFECKGIAFDGTNLWIYDSPRGERGTYQYNLNGRRGRFIENFGGSVMTSDQNGNLFVRSTHQIRVFNIRNLEEIASINLDDIRISRIIAMEWVDFHEEGKLWIADEHDNLMQLKVGDNWEIEVVKSLHFDLRRSISGLTHDGTNLYFSDSGNGRICIIVDDGINEVNWIQLSESSGFSVHQPDNITANLLTKHLSGGEYAAKLNILSNDPLTPLVELPISLEVTGSPLIETTPECQPFYRYGDLEFDDVIVGLESCVDLVIRNPGSEELEIERIVFEDEEVFSTDLENGTIIEPCSYMEASVSITAQDVGEFESRVDIFTNAVNFTEDQEEGLIWFDLIGEAIAPPEVVLEPEFEEGINEHIELHQEQMRISFEILNHADRQAADLEFTISEQDMGEQHFRDAQSGRKVRRVEEHFPERDDFGRLLETHRIPFQGARGITFDGELMWGCQVSDILNYNPDTGEFPDFFDLDHSIRDITIEDNLLWVVGEYSLYCYDMNGNLVEESERYIYYHSITSIGNGQLLLLNWSRPICHIYSTEEGEVIGDFDFLGAMANDAIKRITWVPEHVNGQLWGRSETRFYQAYVDENLNVRAVQDFIFEYDDCMIAHDGENFWINSEERYMLQVIDDGIQEPGEVSWLAIFPISDTIRPGRSETVELVFYTDDLEANSEYQANLIIQTNDPEHEHLEIPVTLTTGRELQRQRIRLGQGWNLISLNVTPTQQLWEREEGPDVILMTEQFRIDEEHHHLLLMKDEDGRFYLPGFGFNNIPYWNLTEGYQVKVDEDVEAVWAGDRIPAETDIPIEREWNLIAYFPTYELDATAPEYYVLSPIIDHVRIAKDGDGNFMMPAFNFSNMPPWRETQGYQVNVDAEVTLSYPPMQEEVAFNPPHRSGRNIPGNNILTATPTGQNMSILVTSFTDAGLINGNQIAAFDFNGRLVGVGNIDDDGRCGLAVWGDDSSTDVKDGLLDGETFELRLWDSRNNVEVDLSIKSMIEGDALQFEEDGFIVIKALKQSVVPEEFALSQNYPNPFNSTTLIAFDIPEVSTVSITIYDLNGREIRNLVDSRLDVGKYTAVWDAGTVTNGVYIVWMKSNNFTAVRKALLVK